MDTLAHQRPPVVENPYKKTIFNEFVAFSDLQNNYQIKRLYALTSKCDCKVQGSTDRHLLVRADQLFSGSLARVMLIGYLNDQNKLWFMPSVDFQIFSALVSVLVLVTWKHVLT